MNDRELTAAGERAAQSLEPETWINEGRELAKSVVYTDQILQQLAEAEGRENLGTMNPPQDYDRTAATASKRRAVESVFRLAELLERLFPNEVNNYK